MKNWFAIFAIMGLFMGMDAQSTYKGLFHSQDLSNPTLHADGVFKFFIASDNELKFGNPEKAILILDNAIAQNPFFAETYLKRSTLLSRLGRFEEARQDFDKAKRLNPYLSSFYKMDKNSGRISLIAFDPKDYERWLADSTLPEFSSMIISSMENKVEGNTTEALTDINQVLDQIQQPDARLYNLRGGIYLLQNDFHRAIADYSQAIQIAPNVAEFYFNRGVAQLFTYDRSAACEDLEMSSMLGFERSEEKLKYFCYY